jgi:hypothetical protein
MIMDADVLFEVGVAAAGGMFSSWNWGRSNGNVTVNANRAFR